MEMDNFLCEAPEAWKLKTENLPKEVQIIPNYLNGVSLKTVYNSV